jgi:hypothetical protein
VPISVPLRLRRLRSKDEGHRCASQRDASETPMAIGLLGRDCFRPKQNPESGAAPGALRDAMHVAPLDRTTKGGRDNK